MFWFADFKPKDINELALRMRNDDIRYIKRVTGLSLLESLRLLFKEYDQAFTLFCGDKVCAVIALSEFNIWVKTNKLTDKHSRGLVRATIELRKVLDQPLYAHVRADDKRVRALCRVMGLVHELEGETMGGIPHIYLANYE